MRKKDLNEKIDIVILWVDGNDEEWLKEKNKYIENRGDKKDNRFRDCDNLQYVFRGIDKFAPWVNKVFFITWGHIPSWLDTNNEKLVIVKHKDFIPEQYLPTFNSNVIELNLHRIEDLSEKFILMNDDLFFLKKLKPEDFFIDGKPTDVYAEYTQLASSYNDVHYMMKANILALINKYFNKEECIKKHHKKFINKKYGKLNEKTKYSMKFKKKFVGFWNFHAPQPYLKETFKKMWELEGELLDTACKNKFRDASDLGHYLCRYWQMVSGDFAPKKDYSKYLTYLNDNTQNIKDLKSKKYKYVCINDAFTDIDFEKSKTEINNVLDELLPEKSKFEI
ncbi:MAG: Stealth CR1 domain-containing protein [Clostridia bacterium]|nr:Stealth CR1 domain-containing protein [Clostridia bacterium]